MQTSSAQNPDFLVIGLQKSGSYWVSALLNAHPDINCFPWVADTDESVRDVHIFDPLGNIDYDGGEHFRASFTKHNHGFFADLVPYLHTVEREALYDMFRERYNAFCDAQRKKKFVGEKQTEYVFHLPIIDYFYPTIPKMCILRDPRDRIVSWHFQQLRKGRKKEPVISDQLVKEYCARVRREYVELYAYEGNLHCLTFEALSTTPEQVVSDMFSYLHVSASEDIVTKALKEASFENYATAGDTKRSRGEEDRTSHYRKGIVGDWKAHLSEDQVAYIQKTLQSWEDMVYTKYSLIS